jgi:hypothetical protein
LQRCFQYRCAFATQDHLKFADWYRRFFYRTDAYVTFAGNIRKDASSRREVIECPAPLASSFPRKPTRTTVFPTAASVFPDRHVEILAVPRLLSALREQCIAGLCLHLIGGKAIAVRADVSNPGDVKNLIQKAVEEFGRLDVKVNNAGVEEKMPFLETPLDVWR